jgi:hypothetical protein
MPCALLLPITAVHTDKHGSGLLIGIGQVNRHALGPLAQTLSASRTA